jgi:hypothetical protein
MAEDLKSIIMGLQNHRRPAPQPDPQAAEHEAQAWRERLTPLEQRVSRVLADIPDAVKAEGLSLESIRQFVVGRWRGKAHPGELGAALRKLGWKRDRRWRGDEIGFRAIWLPPTA